MSDYKQYKPVQVQPAELAAKHMNLVNFLLNGEYPFVETEGGFMVGVTPIRYEEKSAIEVPKKQGIIT